MGISTRTTIWQPDIFEPKIILEGVDAINQSIWLTLGTRPGTVALLPEFGSDMWAYVDQPISVVVSKLIPQIKTDLAAYMPNIEVSSVSYEYQDNPSGSNVLAGIIIKIVWTLAGLTLNPEDVLLFLGRIDSGQAALGRAIGTEDGLYIISGSPLILT